MKLTALLLLAASLALGLLTGCGDGATGPSGPPDYFPIAMGNTWGFTVDGYVVNAGASDTIDLSGTFDREVVDTTMHQQGFEVWKIRETSAVTFTQGDTSITYRDTSFIYTLETANEFLAYNDTVSTVYEIVARLPVTVGETWEPYGGDTTVVREVLSVSEHLALPAGGFSGCLHMEDTDYTAPDDDWDIWCAPGIGPCRVVSHNADSTQVSHIEVEMESYSVN
jgi:hypothetical protein